MKDKKQYIQTSFPKSPQREKGNYSPPFMGGVRGWAFIVYSVSASPQTR